MNYRLLSMSVAALLLAAACTRQESASPSAADETNGTVTAPGLPDTSTDGTTTYPDGSMSAPVDSVPPATPEAQSQPTPEQPTEPATPAEPVEPTSKP